jgi:hypothetical protein
MTADEQLAEWVKGNSLCPNDRGECCPDFSCCQPELKADEATRRAFTENPQKRNEFCGVFLGAAMQSMGKEVYVAGVDDPEKTEQ